MIAKSKPTQVGVVCIDGGNLLAQPASTLIAALSQLELTGCLTFRNGALVKELFFRHGLIVGSSSSHIQDSLGNLLFSWGQISQEDHVRLQHKDDSHWRTRDGERLLSWGAIDAITLNHALHRQILFRIQEIAAWKEGSYIFVPGQVRDQCPPIQTIEALCASVDGIYGNEFVSAKAATLFAYKPTRIFTSPFLPLVNRLPELALFLSRITGNLPLRGLIDFNDSPNTERRILILRDLGCIEIPIPADFAAPRPEIVQPPPGNNIDAVASSEEDPVLLGFSTEEESQMSFQLGKTLLGQRRFAEAEKQFLKCATLAPGRTDYLCPLAWSRILQHPAEPDIIESNIPLLERAVLLSPANADAHFYYGFALHLLGRDAVALCVLEHGLAIAPDREDALTVVRLLRRDNIPASKKERSQTARAA